MSDTTKTGRERRNFFRLQDSVYIEYRQATEAEVKKDLKGEKNAPKADDVSFQLDAVSKQISPLLADLKSTSSAVYPVLELLNRKVDLISSMLFFDHFVNTEEGSGSLSTSTVDISEGGVSFDSQTPFKHGTYVYVRLVIVGFRYGLETFGKVRHCGDLSKEKGADGETPNARFRIGLEFPHLSEYDRKQLTRYIFDRQRELIRNKRKA